MKRVKKGLTMRLPGSSKTRWVLAKEHDGMLRLEEESPHSYDTVDLTAAQCEALGMTAVLEDVPEPWERVAEAIREATKRHQGRDWTLSAAECRYIAEALGIEPEGES